MEFRQLEKFTTFASGVIFIEFANKVIVLSTLVFQVLLVRNIFILHPLKIYNNSRSIILWLQSDGREFLIYFVPFLACVAELFLYCNFSTELTNKVRAVKFVLIVLKEHSTSIVFETTWFYLSDQVVFVSSEGTTSNSTGYVASTESNYSHWLWFR